MNEKTLQTVKMVIIILQTVLLENFCQSFPDNK